MLNGHVADEVYYGTGIPAVGQPDTNDDIVGFVDYKHDDKISGWIANITRPEVLEAIDIVGDAGKVRRIRASFFREDVARHLGVEGIFGFTIPSNIFAGLGDSVSLLTRSGRPLEHGQDIPVVVAGCSRQNNRLRGVFLHIQKAAGTSLRDDIIRSYSVDDILFVYPNLRSGVTPGKLSLFGRDQLQSFRLIFGHMSFGACENLPLDANYFTIVRDPIERLRSHVFHLLRTRKDEDLGICVSDIINNNCSDEFDNLMTRVIAGVAPPVVPCGAVTDELVDLAMSNVRSCFAYVGQVGSSAATYNGLVTLLGASPGSRSHANRRGALEVLDQEEAERIDWPRLVARNRFDVDLYSRLGAEDLLDRPLR